MIKHYFTLNAVPGLTIWITRNGQEITPMPTGRFVPFAIGDVIKINISVIGKHLCYTLDGNNYAKHLPKKDVGMGTGIYEKQVTVTSNNGTGQLPRWPNNMLCVDLNDRQFNIGIANQGGICYFVIEEYISEDVFYLPGQVKEFSVLRGIGKVATGNIMFDHRIHWSAVPKRENGFRYLDSGEEISWEELVSTNGTSTFPFEIKSCALA